MAFERKVSEEFKLYQQQSQTAFEEAGKQERGADNGCDLPLGTRGIATFSGAQCMSTKPKVINGQPIPGKPNIIMEVQIIEPESHQGRKYAKWHGIDDHPSYSKQQKIADFYNYMEDAGLPKELRAKGSLEEVFNWCEQTAPKFPFEVVEGYGGRREIKPLIPTSSPTASATSAAMAAAQSTPNLIQKDSTVMFAGKPFMVISINGDTATIRSNQSGQELPGVLVAELIKL